MGARHRTGNGFVETRRIGVEMQRIIGELPFALGNQPGEIAAPVMLEMPFLGDDIGEERLEARPVTTLCIKCKKKQEAIEKARGL